MGTGSASSGQIRQGVGECAKSTFHGGGGRGCGPSISARTLWALNGCPRSLRWPVSFNLSPISRKLRRSPVSGLARGSRLASATTAGHSSASGRQPSCRSPSGCACARCAAWRRDGPFSYSAKAPATWHIFLRPRSLLSVSSSPEAQLSDAALGEQGDAELLHHELAGEARILDDDRRHAVVLDPVQQFGETLAAFDRICPAGAGGARSWALSRCCSSAPPGCWRSKPASPEPRGRCWRRTARGRGPPPYLLDYSSAPPLPTRRIIIQNGSGKACSRWN